MDELLKKRIDRALEGLPDDKAYQVLDYIEFLGSKFNVGPRASVVQKIADTVEDTLRAARVPAAAIKGTMGVMDTAGRVMRGLASAGEAVVKEFEKGGAPKPDPREPSTPPASPPSDRPKEDASG